MLSKVRKWILHGWPGKRSLGFQPYTTRKDELSEQLGCVLWGSRVVIPAKCRDALLKELHESHPGISRMRSLARSHIWWPKMDADIELCVRNCGMCQDGANIPQASALHLWEWPGRPRFRVHMDYAGPIQNKGILLIVDACSKYIDAHVVSSPSSAVTERMLRRTFATHGSPLVIVSDNASSFTSREFSRFCALNGIKHVRCASYHPSSNGLAERAVQTIKSGVEKVTRDLETRLLHALA